MIDAVLFDFNGVVIDDEPLHDESWREVLVPLDINYTDEEYYGPLLGVPDAEFLRLLLARRGVEMSPSRQLELLAAKSVIYDRLVRERPVDLPGLAAFVRDLAGHVPVGVVSGALRHEIEYHLARLDIAECVAAVLAAGEYAKPKPDPAPYLTGLAKLNEAVGRAVRPGEVVVIEDSTNGVKSALAAGMAVVGVTARTDPERLPGCFAWVADFNGCDYDWLVRTGKGNAR
ncbi:MAG: HAD family phosphatase [Candidatus Lernaella stagnicola]|nr:HAD family phosphatase [Candidatus Lernaella stagnicola]